MAFNPVLITSAFNFQDGFQTTLSAGITAADTVIPLTALPAGDEGTLVIEPGTANEEEIYFTSQSTGVVNCPSASAGRGVNSTAVAHNSGVVVKMLVTKASLDAIKYAGAIATKKKAGWEFLIAAGTRVGNTSFTVVGDVTDRISVGDKIELTDTTTKYYYVTAVAYTSSTLITVTGGTDYLVVGNPSNIYYSKSSSPVGFPANSDTFSPIGINRVFSTADQNNIGTNEVSVSNLSIACTIPTGKSIEVTSKVKFVTNGTNNNWYLLIKEDGTQIGRTNQLCPLNPISYGAQTVMCIAQKTPTAGAHTYTVTFQSNVDGNLVNVADTGDKSFLAIRIR